VELGAQAAIPQWSQVLNDRHWLFSAGPFFLELFAGKAGITEAVFLAGVPVLPPVDIVASDLVRTPVDLVDAIFLAEFGGYSCSRCGFLSALRHPVQYVHCCTKS
jgi:hypothetical protein